MLQQWLPLCDILNFSKLLSHSLDLGLNAPANLGDGPFR